FAVVHLCWKRYTPEKRFALKVINTRVGDTASLNRIREEINILQTLGNHPGMVSLIDVDETLVGNIRLVLELCEGGELYDRIQQKQYPAASDKPRQRARAGGCIIKRPQKPNHIAHKHSNTPQRAKATVADYPEHEAKACCRQLMEAVSFIHANGIMHRDLKPENILLASKVSNTDIKISDFGLAKISRDFPRKLPRSHSICGSDFYLAPEVIKQEEYGREIDVWAVGVITYVLLSGSLPFFHNVLHKLYRQDLSFPEQAWKNVSKGALDFILRLLQVRAGDRLTADQALSHPWLRGTGGSSFTSFESGAPSRRSGGAAGPHPGGCGAPQPSVLTSGSLSRESSDVSLQARRHGAAVHPLEHAHMVARIKAAPGRYGPPPGSVAPHF
ncbi:unnamed protein product, partial [Prorocentrum cordatum]